MLEINTQIQKESRMTEIQLLKDSNIFPNEKVLEEALGSEVYGVYNQLTKILHSPEFGLHSEWNYYKDGKAWLCKVTHRKKTVFWLSVWEKQIKTGFYFTEKTATAIAELPVNEKMKQHFAEARSIGKLIPLSLNIEKAEQLEDLKLIIRYKKELK